MKVFVKLLKNAPRNIHIVSPNIHEDIYHCFVQEILKFIIVEIGNDVFTLLVDESSNVSKKEQMVFILKY